jgi:hypothetical protein
MVGRCANNTPTEQRVLNGDHDLDDAPAAFRTHFIRSEMAMFTANSAVAGSIILARGQNEAPEVHPATRASWLPVAHRHGGRHDIYRNPANGRQAPVPRHREIAGTLCGIIRRQLGLEAGQD